MTSQYTEYRIKLYKTLIAEWMEEHRLQYINARAQYYIHSYNYCMDKMAECQRKIAHLQLRLALLKNAR